MGSVCDSGLSQSGALQGTLRACRTAEPGHSDTGSLSGGCLLRLLSQVIAAHQPPRLSIFNTDALKQLAPAHLCQCAITSSLPLHTN